MSHHRLRADLVLGDANFVAQSEYDKQIEFEEYGINVCFSGAGGNLQLGDPDVPDMKLVLSGMDNGSAVVVTAASPIGAGGSTTMTFAIGDWVQLESRIVGKLANGDPMIQWRVIANEGVTFA